MADMLFPQAEYTLKDRELTGALEFDLQPWEVVYDVDPRQPFGPRWRAQRPPGLPTYARLASRPGEAVPYIELLAEQKQLGSVFVTTLAHLATTESGGRFALPANSFDARPESMRPPGKPLITAWGAFQFNRDAWRSMPGVSSTAYPWDSTPYDELSRPISRYVKLFSDVTKAGGSGVDAARGIRLWHRTPVGYQTYLHRGRDSNFASAWQQVDPSHRTRVDAHLHAAGIL